MKIIYLHIASFISQTANYLFEMLGKIIFTTYFSEFILHRHKIQVPKDLAEKNVFNSTLYLDTKSKFRS